MTALDDIVGRFRKASPNVAAAFDEVQRRLAVLEKPVVVPPPPPVVAAGITVTVDELQAAVNNSKGGEVFLVKPGTARYQLFLPSWANVQVRGLDPANPPVFVGGGLDGYYAIYSEGASTIGPDLTVSNPNGYGIGVRANASNITGGRVTGISLYRNGISGLYQGTQPGRTHTGFKIDNVIGRENGQRLDLDPHNIKGDGEHTIYIGGGEGITTGALVTSSTSYDQLHGTAFQGGGGLRDSTFVGCSAYRIRKSGTQPASSYAGFGIFSSFQGTSGIVFDGCLVEDCDGYGFKAIGGATGIVKNSSWKGCALGGTLNLTDGGSNAGY